jgi:hypothetical protein
MGYIQFEEKNIKRESIERPDGFPEKEFLKNWISGLFIYRMNLLGIDHHEQSPYF